MFEIKLTTINSFKANQKTFGDPNIIFEASSSLPAQIIPCTENSDGQLIITNNGDASDICCIVCQILNHWDSPIYVPVDGNVTFHMDAGETKTLVVTTHFDPEYWNQNTTINWQWWVGWQIDSTTMKPTDTVTFTVQVKGGNGNGGECESYTTELTCKAAGCYWYPYPNPIGDSTCHNDEWYMSYLPFILAGVGGAIIIAALVMRSPKPTSYPPQKNYPT